MVTNMKNKNIWIYLLLLITSSIVGFVIGYSIVVNPTVDINITNNIYYPDSYISYPVQDVPPIYSIQSEKYCDITISNEEIELLALLTMAEAEGEPIEGQRLVISTVLNRVDSEYFPNTIYDVIWQDNQFSCMTNGRFERCIIKDDIRNLVLEEVKSRTNYEVIYFTADNFGKYGTPLLNIGNHYFSTL